MAKEYAKSKWLEVGAMGVYKHGKGDDTFFNVSLNDTFSITVDKIYPATENSVKIRIVVEPKYLSGKKAGQDREIYVFNRDIKDVSRMNVDAFETLIERVKDSKTNNIISRKLDIETKMKYLFAK